MTTQAAAAPAQTADGVDDREQATAQLAEQEPAQLEGIVVTAPRIETPLAEVAGAVAVVTTDDIQLARQGIGLDESLDRVPGVFMQNRYNFAQDLRVSIRGAGARAPFGIRGIMILADGIPLTLPDGQASLDTIDLDAVARMEVLRGPSSSLYGNASGGVLHIISEHGPPVPAIELRSKFGSHGFSKYTLKGGGEQGPINYFSSLSRLDYEGYRDHAAARASKWNANLSRELNDGDRFTVVLGAVDAPMAQDPGALTAEQVAANRHQASPGNLHFDAGEELRTQRLGITYANQLDDHREFRLRGYSTWRDFATRLPFTDGGMVQFQRLFTGAGATYIHAGNLWGRDQRLLAGIDMGWQRDDRQRHDNLAGTRGALVSDQLERVSALGVFVQSQTALTDRLRLVAGLRLDRVRFEVDDAFLGDGTDNSGSRTLDATSPKLGLSWRLAREFIAYANVSRSFETPTTTELAPCSGGGLSNDLQAQTATNYEVGARGSVDGGWNYSLTLFHIDGSDEIIPQGCPGQAGRSFFVNSGKTRRNGIEFGLDADFGHGLSGHFAYTWSDFAFDRFRLDGTNFAGNTIPGVPEHAAFLGFEYHHDAGFFAAAELRHAGSLYADNANAVSSKAWTTTDVRVGWARRIARCELTFSAALNNAFGERYNSNVRINAFGGRYFEPAPERNHHAEVTLRYSFGT